MIVHEHDKILKIVEQRKYGLRMRKPKLKVNSIIQWTILIQYTILNREDKQGPIYLISITDKAALNVLILICDCLSSRFFKVGRMLSF